MKRFPEDAKDGEPYAIIPESDREWLGIETDIGGWSALKIIAWTMAESAVATFALVGCWLGWWS